MLSLPQQCPPPLVRVPLLFACLFTRLVFYMHVPGLSCAGVIPCRPMLRRASISFACCCAHVRFEVLCSRKSEDLDSDVAYGFGLAQGKSWGGSIPFGGLFHWVDRKWSEGEKKQRRKGDGGARGGREEGKRRWEHQGVLATGGFFRQPIGKR